MNIVQVLGTILAFDDELKVEVIEDILGMEEGDLRLVLSGLSSLMEDANDEGGERLNRRVMISSLTSPMLHLVIICSMQVARANFMSTYRNMILHGALN